MKTLYDLDRNDTAIIKKLHAVDALKARLISLGLAKGNSIAILECAPAKQTIQIEIGTMKLALRDTEAKMIEVYE